MEILPPNREMGKQRPLALWGGSDSIRPGFRKVPWRWGAGGSRRQWLGHLLVDGGGRDGGRNQWPRELLVFHEGGRRERRGGTRQGFPSPGGLASAAFT